jgi:hypothetical protein
MQPDAHLDAPFGSRRDVALGQRLLDRHGTAGGIHGAGELHEKPIAHRIDP